MTELTILEVMDMTEVTVLVVMDMTELVILVGDGHHRTNHLSSDGNNWTHHLSSDGHHWTLLTLNNILGLRKSKSFQIANECLHSIQWGVRFSPGTLVVSTNKTERHYIAELLLKVPLNTITGTLHVRNVTTVKATFDYHWRVMERWVLRGSKISESKIQSEQDRNRHNR